MLPMSPCAAYFGKLPTGMGTASLIVRYSKRRTKGNTSKRRRHEMRVLTSSRRVRRYIFRVQVILPKPLRNVLS